MDELESDGRHKSRPIILHALHKNLKYIFRSIPSSIVQLLPCSSPPSRSALHLATGAVSTNRVTINESVRVLASRHYDGKTQASAPLNATVGEVMESDHPFSVRNRYMSRTHRTTRPVHRAWGRRSRCPCAVNSSWKRWWSCWRGRYANRITSRERRSP